MSDIYVGKLEKKVSREGKTYFKGFFGKIPIIAFFGRQNPDQINIKLDVSFIEYIAKKEEDENKTQAQDQVQDENLPF